MRRSPRSFLAPAAVLLLGWGLLDLRQPDAQETQGEPPSAAVTGAEPRQEEASKQEEKPRGHQRKPRRQGRPLLPGSTPPPTNLKLVGDHWTPYDPPDPESFPPEATLHIIVPGDTLWDLADLAYGNPYLWPQIWNENRYILDSHWIYPGDPLLLPARPTVVGEVVPQAQEGAPPTEPGESEPLQETPTAEGPEQAPPAAPPSEIARAPRPAPRPERLADERDILCSGFIARREQRADYFIANQEDEAKVGLTEGDVIYLNRGKETGHVEPGTEYSIIVREGEVRHPITNRMLGIYYQRLGTVRVVAGQDYTAIAIISMACDEIRTGYDLVPLRVTFLPAKPAPRFNRLKPIDLDKTTGYVVHTLDNIERAGTGHLVDIDLGFEDGLNPGDFLTVYLPSQPYDKYRKIEYDYQWGNRRFQSPPERRDDRHLPPPKVIGQLVVLATEKHTATTKIIDAVREIEVGDSVVVH
jgi:hypothetical protein